MRIKTKPPPYRPLLFWPLYSIWETYIQPVVHKHKWCRVSGSSDADAVIICYQCGETR